MASLYAGLRRAETCFPNSTATVFLDRRMSWKAFGDEVRELAHALRGVGVRRGHRMAVVARNSDCMLQYMYAAACLGVVFVPLNVRYKDGIHITHSQTHQHAGTHSLCLCLSPPVEAVDVVIAKGLTQVVSSGAFTCRSRQRGKCRGVRCRISLRHRRSPRAASVLPRS